jgi:hypothetical protein
MLLSTCLGCAPSFLSGLGVTAEEAAKIGVNATNIIALQKALKALSVAANNPMIDPGDATGLIGGYPPDRTMAAVAASVNLIGPKLGTFTRAALAIALGVGASTTQAKQYVMTYAVELTRAVQAATIAAPYYVKPPAAPAAETPTIFATSGPWYKTWWGIGAIAVGVIGSASLVMAHRRA